MRKLSANITKDVFLFILFLFACCGCNKDAYLEKLSLSQTQVLFGPTSDSVLIALSIPHWEISNVQIMDTIQSAFSYKIRDRHSNDFTSALPATLRGIYLEDGFKYVFQKTPNNRLKVLAGENLSDKDVRFRVELTDGIQNAELLVTQKGGLKYEVDSVHYSLIPNSIQEFVRYDSSFIDVETDQEVSASVLSDAFTYGRFYCAYPICYQILGGNIKLDTPLTIKHDGTFVMDGGKKSVNLYGERGRASLNRYQNIKLRSDVTNEIVRMTCYRIYSASFKCFVHNNINGTKRVLTGEYRCISPIVEKSTMNIIYNEKNVAV